MSKLVGRIAIYEDGTVEADKPMATDMEALASDGLRLYTAITLTLLSTDERFTDVFDKMIEATEDYVHGD